MKYTLFLMAESSDDRGHRPTLDLGSVEGDGQTIAESLRYSLENIGGVGGSRPRGRPVKVLWYEPLLASDPLAVKPDIGVVYPSLRALALGTGAKLTSLNQELSRYKYMGFAGAVHRGMAFAFEDRLQRDAGQMPARRKTGLGGMEIIAAKDWVPTFAEREAILDQADPHRHIKCD
jgi:hypothetical protein